MPAALSRRRIEVLKDARTRLDIRGERLELAGLRFWTRRPQDIARVLRESTDTVILLAHDPRRLTEAAALECARRSVRTHPRRPSRPAGRRGAGAHAAFPCSRDWDRGEHVDLREPGNRNRLRPGANQLPAGGRADHVEAALSDLTNRRPSTRQPPSSISCTASGYAAVLLRQDPRGQRVRRIAVEHRHRRAAGRSARRRAPRSPGAP